MLLRIPANLSCCILTWSSLDAEQCTLGDFHVACELLVSQSSQIHWTQYIMEHVMHHSALFQRFLESFYIHTCMHLKVTVD